MMYQQQVQGQMRPNPNPYPAVMQGQGLGQGQGQGMKAMGQGQNPSRQVQSYQTQGHQQALYPTDFGHGHSALNGAQTDETWIHWTSIFYTYLVSTIYLLFYFYYSVL